METRDNGEGYVVVQEALPNIECTYIKQDMIPLYGEKMYIRASVAERLEKAQQILSDMCPTWKLKLAYAYRHPDVQQKYFDERLKEMRIVFPDADELELIRQAHLLSASPDVAGHPTGGAIDVTLTSPEGEIDMGTAIADFSDSMKIRTFVEGLEHDQKKHRLLLRNILIEVGFAPFDGEWWHFSYGDKEWATYYEKEFAIYGPLKIEGV